ncbi:MAG: hypothetical protein LQ345_006459 [Seirophora villosa]|nr:MAG: hypothetical protein LQ345_006459 [Seirophora villosa]
MADSVLDTTLKDLYRDGEGEDPSILSQSVRYAYQSPNVLFHDPDSLGRLYLQLIPQWFAFVAGAMPLVMFDLDHAKGGTQSHRDDAYRTFEQLTYTQRPQLVFVEQPSDIKLPVGAKIAVLNPMDCLLTLPHTVNPDAHYDLLSKRSLALSHLPSPASAVIDTILRAGEVYENRALEAEVDRMMEAVHARACPFPFVAKVPQSLSGEGVFLIRDELERQHAVQVLKRELKRWLTLMQQSKAQMLGTSIVLQELIIGENVALAFFVTRKGRAIFSSCCQQLVDPHGRWEGGSISYAEQDRYQAKFARILEQLGNYMHRKGYYGPVGADGITDEEGRQFIIDMNVRVIGSHPLGYLKTHFSVERGLNEAVVLFPLFLDCRREAFEKIFEQQFQAGTIIAPAWCHDKEGTTSITTIIVAAEDKANFSFFGTGYVVVMMGATCGTSASHVTADIH